MFCSLFSSALSLLLRFPSKTSKACYASVSRPEAKALRTGGAALRPAKLREMNGEDATHFGFDDFCQVLEGNIIYDTASAAIPATSIIFVGCCKQG